MGVIMMTSSWEHQIEPLAYKALNIMLDDYEKDWFTFYHGSTWKIIRENEPDDAIEKIKELVNDNGFVHFHPAILNQHSNLLIDLERINDVIELRELNVDYYPRIHQLYDFLAEAYLKNGQNDLAIKNYEKSLELNPENENAREMLTRLKN